MNILLLYLREHTDFQVIQSHLASYRVESTSEYDGIYAK